MLGETGLVSVNLIKSGPPFCTLHIVHCTLISFRLGREAKRNGAFAVRFRVSLRVACFSAITALADYTCFGNHSAGGKPMHHSVLPEEGGVGPRGWSSSSRHVVARQDRMAKRNPVHARACADMWRPFSDLLCTCGLIAHRFFLLLRVGGSVWPVKASL